MEASMEVDFGGDDDDVVICKEEDALAIFKEEDDLVIIKDDDLVITKEEDDLVVIEEEAVEITETKPNVFPIVYTTRLDDMCIFKQDLDGMTAKDITDCIGFESKPLLNKPPRFSSPDRQKNRLFMKLVQKLNEINCKTNAEHHHVTFEEIKEEIVADDDPPANIDAAIKKTNDLLRLCRPVSVKLEKLSIHQINQYQGSNVDICVLADRKVDGILYDKHRLKFRGSAKNAYLYFKLEKANVSDLYFVNSDGRVTEWWKNNLVVRNNKVRKLIRFLYCCWHQRELMITQLWPKHIDFASANFMRQPHTCISGKCLCCCRKDKITEGTSAHLAVTVDNAETNELSDNLVSVQKDELQVLEHETSATIKATYQNVTNNLKTEKQSVWIKDLLKKRELTNNVNFINKALKFQAKIHQENQLKVAKTNILAKSDNCPVKVAIKDSDTNIYEIYNIGSSGDITNFAKSSDPLHHCLYKVTCCWYKREQIIADLNLHNKATIKFMKKLHTCKSGECTCCCKPVNPNNDKNPHKYSSIRLSNISMTEQKGQKKNLPTLNLMNLVVPPLPFDKENKINFLHLSSQFNEEPHKAETHKFENVDPKSQPLASTSEQLCVDSLITTILDRFKDVRLTINADGKVAAALNTPVTTLNTAELKVLANILSHAQEQVNALGVPQKQTNLNFTWEKNNLTIVPPPTSTTSNNINKIQNEADDDDVVIISQTDSTQFDSMSTADQPRSLNPSTYTHNPVYKSFSDLNSVKVRNFNRSFICHASVVSKKTCIPQIKNVFSLRSPSDPIKTNNGEKMPSLESGTKRKSIDNPEIQSKIRVLPLSQLGAREIANEQKQLPTDESLDMQIPQFKILRPMNNIPNVVQCISHLTKPATASANTQFVPPLVASHTRAPASNPSNNVHFIPLVKSNTNSGIQILPKVSQTNAGFQVPMQVVPGEVPNLRYLAPKAVPVKNVNTNNFPLLKYRLLNPMQSGNSNQVQLMETQPIQVNNNQLFMSPQTNTLQMIVPQAEPMTPTPMYCVDKTQIGNLNLNNGATLTPVILNHTLAQNLPQSLPQNSSITANPELLNVMLREPPPKITSKKDIAPPNIETLKCNEQMEDDVEVLEIKFEDDDSNDISFVDEGGNDDDGACILGI